jgi:hypothetical protein
MTCLPGAGLSRGCYVKNLDGTRGQGRNWPFLGLNASFCGRGWAISLDDPSKGAAMNDIITWIQNNWYEAGSLTAQFTFVLAALWFARRILRTLRGSQEQIGALLKLSVSDGLSERSKAGETVHRPTPYVMAEWPATSEPAAAPEIQETGPETPALTLPGGQQRGGIIGWLQAPMKKRQIAPLRKVARWLQEPSGS